MADKPQAKVTKVGIGRLFNLGNYEHIRYDLTIEIPEGADALDAVNKTRQILRALKPLPAKSYDDRRAETLVAMTYEEREEAIQSMKYSPEDFTKAVDRLLKRSARAEKRKAALELFNNLGGESVYTDHKEQWDDEYDD